PPSSPPFPYTTLFRSVVLPPRRRRSRVYSGVRRVRAPRGRAPGLGGARPRRVALARRGGRALRLASGAQSTRGYFVNTGGWGRGDRKSTRLNSSHVSI